MAKKDKNDGKPSETAAVTLISQKSLVALLKEDDNYKGKIDGLVGELRETIGNAVEKKHLNKQMYALLKKFHRYKSIEKLADDWRTLLAYMDMAGIMAKIDTVTPLPIEGDNVHRLQPAQQAAE